MYKIIDGKAHSLAIRGEIAERATAFKAKYGVDVGLAVVLIGNNPASQVYVRNKIKACEQTGIKSFAYYLPEETTQAQAEELICNLVSNPLIHGILVQLPIPKHLNTEKILSLIPVDKDVDGFCAENVGRLSANKKGIVACTPNGVMQMLKREDIEIKGKRAVVVGRSDIVGKPMAMLLTNADATVTVCHSKTVNLKDITSQAEILVCAIGKAKFITADMVKDGAVVIDVGMNRDENDKLCGDVDYENVKDKCSYITPVPGGVGPMTITMLLYNAVITAERSVEVD